MDTETIFSKIGQELFQTHETRKKLYSKIEETLKKPIVCYFTSFVYPVMIDDSDVNMLEQVLRTMPLQDGFYLVINSPGGDGLAAERIINLCRSYSGTKNFTAIVPGKAKSAATMICLGADEIWMGVSSELGPIDPQITIQESTGVAKRFSIYNIIESYKELTEKAVTSQGHIEPYLQQLARYDAREIKGYEAAFDLSKDIAMKALKTGMMKTMDNKAIERKIVGFLDPSKTKSHGRPIFRDESQKCGLKIVSGETHEVWDLIYELYFRLDSLLTRQVAKCVESATGSFTMPVPAK